MHSDVLILKLWFAVQCEQDAVRCATDSVSVSPTGCSSLGGLNP